MTNRILVAGGAGFIGTHLIGFLLGQGHSVICIDNLSTGFKTNLDPFINHPAFEFIQGNILTPLNLEVDQIYNLACPASPLNYQLDPIGTIQTSVIGTLRMAELAQRCGAKILQASTSEVYGNPKVHPQPESYLGGIDSTGPRACYDAGKLCAETVLFDFHRMHGLPVKIARLFNVYGSHLHSSDGRVVGTFISQALDDEPITVFGDGSQTRSFCFVDDLIMALTKFMETDPNIIGPINLGNPEEISILELADTIRNLCGSKSKLIFEPLPIDDPTRRLPDITLAKKVLDWQPTTPLSAGLGYTIDWYRENMVSDRFGVDQLLVNSFSG